MLRNVWTFFYLSLTLILGVRTIIIPVLQMRRLRLAERHVSKIRGQEVTELEFKARDPHFKTSALRWSILPFSLMNFSCISAGNL